MIGDGMPGKLTVFAALVKARGPTGPGDSASILIIYAVTIKITPCNPWIFS
jgi:hypothetical protein